MDGFLAAGHVCSVMGTGQYEPLAERYHVPIVVTGFEPLDVLDGIRRCVLQLEAGRGEVENAYPRAVRPEGNPAARAMLDEVFEVCDRSWRGIGTIPASGWRLTPGYAAFDAERRFDVADLVADEPTECRAGEVLQGLITPDRCEWFGTTCTPRTPDGGDHGVRRGRLRRLLPVPAGDRTGGGPACLTPAWRGRPGRPARATSRGGAARPRSIRFDRVVMGHGGGGTLTAELIEQLFLPAFGSAATTATPTDAAVLGLPGGTRLAFTTDTYVVQPLVFPGGDIGELAVFGTVNDLAMSGAVPLALSTAFVLEEGLDLDLLAAVASSMGRAALRAGVGLVTGDTKVVERGHGDGLYVNTAGVGIVPDGVDVRPGRATPGDVVLVSGPLGMHGIAVLSRREGLEFGTDLRSDTAPLAGLVASMLAADPDLHVLRDLTRGGLAAGLCELATTAGVGIEFEEAAVPVPEAVRAGCGFLGLDPLHVANEGKLVAFVSADRADAVLAAMCAVPEGLHGAAIGRVVADHPGVVVARTGLGAARVVDRPLGEQLPRIC